MGKPIRKSISTFALLLAVCPLFAAEKVFDPTRDSARDLAAAQAQAASEHKYILLDVGGNWCPWCIVLDRTLHQQPDLKAALESNFVVVHVNWSMDQQNETFLAHYPKVNGYPYFFVLSPSGKLLRAQPTDALETDHKIGNGYNHSAVLDFLNQWASHPGA